MSATESQVNVDQRICLHPSVGLWADPARMTPEQKVATVAKVRCLEHDLLEGESVRRSLSRDEADMLIGEINGLRSALGWLELNVDGRWRWPHQAA